MVSAQYSIRGIVQFRLLFPNSISALVYLHNSHARGTPPISILSTFIKLVWPSARTQRLEDIDILLYYCKAVLTSGICCIGKNWGRKSRVAQLSCHFRTIAILRLNWAVTFSPGQHLVGKGPCCNKSHRGIKRWTIEQKWKLYLPAALRNEGFLRVPQFWL